MPWSRSRHLRIARADRKARKGVMCGRPRACTIPFLSPSRRAAAITVALRADTAMASALQHLEEPVLHAQTRLGKVVAWGSIPSHWRPEELPATMPAEPR